MTEAQIYGEVAVINSQEVVGVACIETMPFLRWSTQLDSDLAECVPHVPRVGA